MADRRNYATMQFMVLTVFFRLTLGLLSLCFLLCLLCRAGDGGLPDDARWADSGFAVCELPCFADITPGKTSFRQVTPLLRSNITTLDRLYNSGSVINFWAQNQRFSGSFRDESGVVVEVHLNTSIPLEPFLAAVQAPDCIVVGTPEHPQRRFSVVWVRKHVSIGAVLNTETEINIKQTRILALWMQNSIPDDCAAGDARAWHGFAPLWAYHH